MNDSSRHVFGGNSNIVYNNGLVSFINSKLSVVNNFISDFYNNIKTLLSPSNLNLRPTVEVIATQFGFYLTTYIAVCYILYLIRALFRNHLIMSKYFISSAANRILLVVTHPDEECMFFGPFILRMVEKNKCPYLLCLSNGKADGNEQLRKKELLASCRVLGMKPENVFLCYSSLRVEGENWNSQNVASLIRDYVEALEIDTLVAFDKNGINGHENRIVMCRAVNFLNIRKQLPINCSIFLLESMGLLRTYSGMIDVIWSLYLSKNDNVFILSTSEHNQVQDALKMHKSQLFLYRRLYMMFSRFTYVNTLCEQPRYRIPI